LASGSAADALGGRVGGDELGVALFELPELDDEGVEVGVGDFGGVEDEVAVLVVGDLRAELFDAELGAGDAGDVGGGGCGGGGFRWSAGHGDIVGVGVGWSKVGQLRRLVRRQTL
jgi:hypothetical protein